MGFLAAAPVASPRPRLRKPLRIGLSHLGKGDGTPTHPVIPLQAQGQGGGMDRVKNPQRNQKPGISRGISPWGPRPNILLGNITLQVGMWHVRGGP